ILSFDDTYERHCCDFLLNQNIHAKQESYNGLVNQGCYLMCGLEYALIRKEFKDARNRCESSEKGIKNILLTLGGADPDNTTLEILKHIEKMQICNIKITVVLGGSNPYINEIKSFVASSKMSIEIVIDAKNMAELMCSADIAISAAGSTTIELLYMRKPFFALAIADNQNIVYEALINKGLAWNVLEIDERLQKLLSNNLIFNRDIEIATKQVSKETI
ncbi:MAG TPA: UDP-2,4-diacetamido-2,4,6-trideoxy-beta-L-altropyranose hydrolase, partial [Campylobacterales bacterium]|nr:UDP-2,4-diacetamido-2,4,6-trideoxy-beta-L-altropyranose hydrolase [Campylobacterales bacterium]